MRHAARPSECAPAASGARAGGQYTCGPYYTPGWPPWHPVRHPVRRTADARRVRAVYRQLTPPRAGLAHSVYSLTASRRHRRPHSSHTDRHHCHCLLTYALSQYRLPPSTPTNPPVAPHMSPSRPHARHRILYNYLPLAPAASMRTRRTATALTTSTMTTSSTIDHPPGTPPPPGATSYAPLGTRTTTQGVRSTRIIFPHPLSTYTTTRGASVFLRVRSYSQKYVMFLRYKLPCGSAQPLWLTLVVYRPPPPPLPVHKCCQSVQKRCSTTPYEGPGYTHSVPLVGVHLGRWPYILMEGG